jgi:hypothetical protein
MLDMSGIIAQNNSMVEKAIAVIKIADIEDNLNPERMLAPTKENLSRVKKYYQALEILRAY